jgi:membrane-bound serine protease (ClpP class)
MARWLWLACMVALCMMPVRAASDVAPATSAAPAVTTGMVAQLALDGPIGPAAAEYFDDA